MRFETPNTRVLVLVPAYRHGKYLRKRVDSILDQTFTDFHVLIIDDCSPDDSAQVLAQYDSDPRITVHVRAENSGSPFAAWEDAVDSLQSDYLWIAESDDFADPTFLETAVARLDDNPAASMYFCNSWIVDEDNLIVGHSINYLKQHFDKIDWSKDHSLDGAEFLNDAQIFGNAVPNISSALFRAQDFKAGFSPMYRFYRLAADWLFVGRMAALGPIEFGAASLNHFRLHANTARSETMLETTCAEYWHAIFAIGKLDGVKPERTNASLIRCATMFTYNGGSFVELAKAIRRFSLWDTVQIFSKLGLHVVRDGRFIERIGAILRLRRAAR